jgi:L-asparaginase / beta-aspartyl-peptidase
MKRVVLVLTVLVVACSSPRTAQEDQGQKKPGDIVLVIHGGAGTLLRENMSAEMEAAYQGALVFALQTGYDVLKKGGTSLDAVEATVRTMEDNPLFNAGKGAVFTNEGRNELDAAIMDGKNLAAGAVASVTTIRNPISAARKVMENSPHVMMIGAGAEKFAQQQGLDIVPNTYFYTEDRWQGLLRAKRADSIKAAGEKKSSGLRQPENRDEKYGTVGAVALDSYGNLAAATSTGGMTNKKFGRVGDAPIIGAGTYANNNTCAVSCTGWGEFFIRLSVAKSVSDLMEYKGLSVNDAANEMIMNKVPALGGDGGLIALDRQGNFTMPFNTSGMYRGYIRADGHAVVSIFK